MPPAPDSLPPLSARLESLRGLASIQVAVFHCLLIMESYPCNQQFIPAMLVLFNGRAAVTLFFVLSGYVLGLSLRRSRGTFAEIYSHYAIRRVFRIYPTVVVSTFIITLLVLVCPMPGPTKSVHLNGLASHEHVNLALLINQLLFIKFINPVTWTLRMEMVCSLFLPLALLIEQWRPRLLPWILAVMIVVALRFPMNISIAVSPAFMLGFLLPRTLPWWQGAKANWLLNAAILLLGVVALLVPRSFHWTIAPMTLIEAIGGVLIIGSIMYGAHLPIFQVLDHHLIKAAGRVSYSYYVYHPIILYILAHILLRLLPEPFFVQYPLPASLLFWVISSIFAFPVAAVSYARIEKPFINYAKTLYRPADKVMAQI